MPKFKSLKPAPPPATEPLPIPTISVAEAERTRLASLHLRLNQVIERGQRTGRFEHDIASDLKGIADALER